MHLPEPAPAAPEGAGRLPAGHPGRPSFSSVVNPVERIVAAMPGSLAELAAATGYDTRSLLRYITIARKEGHSITARRVNGETIFEVVVLTAGSSIEP